jgi:hypothetical protein
LEIKYTLYDLQRTRFSPLFESTISANTILMTTSTSSAAATRTNSNTSGRADNTLIGKEVTRKDDGSQWKVLAYHTNLSPSACGSKSVDQFDIPSSFGITGGYIHVEYLETATEPALVVVDTRNGHLTMMYKNGDIYQRGQGTLTYTSGTIY